MLHSFKRKTDHAVLIDFDIKGLVDPVSKIDALETTLNQALVPFGESDGHELGGGEGTIFLYGADAEKMYARIETVLKNDSLCKNGRVTIRRGGPGSPQREIRL